MRARLGIGVEGRVVLPRREAQELGLADGDEVEVQCARGSFALVARAGGSRQAYFAGSLSALGVAEALHYVFTSLKTGVMLLAFRAEGEGGGASSPRADPQRRKSVYFRDGQVVFASSSDPSDRLGAVLERHGIVGREDLERCGQLVEAGRPLGQVLVDEGLLSAGELYEGMTLQVREIVLAACLETEGEFTFLEGPFDEKNAVKMLERTRELLLEGMRRIDEVERMEAEALPNRDAALRPTGASPPEDLDAAERKLLELVDGRRAARQVIELSRLGTFLGMRAIVGLLGRGLLHSVAAGPPPARVPAAAQGPGGAGEAGAPRLSGPFETYRRIFKRIFEALGSAHPDAQERLNSYFARLPEKQRPIFEGVGVAEDGEVDVAQVFLNVEAAGTYRGAAARARALEALEAFLAFALFEVKNCLPRAEAESLLREVGRMQVGKA